MNQLELEFPMQWEYKIIAVRSDEVFDSLCRVIRSCGFDERPRASNVSRNNSYVTYTVGMRIETREQLDQLTRALGQCAGVKYLL